MTLSFTPVDSLLFRIVLGTLAVGLPILLVLCIRFLWDRNLSLSRSKELDKLIWQLHRIASAMEHQMNLSFPAVQPGTEEPRDLAYFQQPAAQPIATTSRVETPNVTAADPSQLAVTQPMTPPQADQRAPLPAIQRRAPSAAAPRGGVNSMFDL